MDGIVDDGIQTDVDAFLLGFFTGLGTGTYLESDDDGLRSGSQRDIALGNLTHSLMDDTDSNLLGGQFDERVAQSLHRTVHIALDDDVEFLEATLCYTVAYFFERGTVAGAQALLTLQLQSFVGDVANFLFRLHHVEGVACLRGTVEAQ